MSADEAPEGGEEAPRVLVERASCSPTSDSGIWNVAWTVTNDDVEPMEVHGAWLPHGRFRAPRRSMEPPLGLMPGEGVVLSFPVQCREEPGTVIENCFVILNLSYRGAEWQVFARLTVRFDAGGAPAPETVLVTAQRAGFSV